MNFGQVTYLPVVSCKWYIRLFSSLWNLKKPRLRVSALLAAPSCFALRVGGKGHVCPDWMFWST